MPLATGFDFNNNSIFVLEIKDLLCFGIQNVAKPTALQ